MLIQPDLNDLQKEIVPGAYNVRVVESSIDEWQGKEGKPNTKYVKWVLETFGADTPADNGRRIWHTTPITGRGAFLLTNFYKAAMGESMNTDSPSFDTEQIHGREMHVVVDKNAKGYIEVKAVSSL